MWVRDGVGWRLCGFVTVWVGDGVGGRLGGLRYGVLVGLLGQQWGLKKVAWFVHAIKNKYVNNEWNSINNDGGDVMIQMLVMMMMFEACDDDDNKNNNNISNNT